MASGDTRVRLILAAEKLFAERGIEGVSLREINVAAGQRNTSASHYHFGSKAALVGAVLNHRAADLRAARLARLDGLEDGPPERVPRAVVEAFVSPTAQMMATAPAYLRFMAQLFLHPPIDWRQLVSEEDSAMVRAARLLSAATGAPEGLMLHRMVELLQLLSTAMASHLRASEAGGALVSEETLVLNLVDCLTGFIAAKPSERTLASLAIMPPPEAPEPV